MCKPPWGACAHTHTHTHTHTHPMMQMWKASTSALWGALHTYNCKRAHTQKRPIDTQKSPHMCKAQAPHDADVEGIHICTMGCLKPLYNCKRGFPPQDADVEGS